MLLILLLSVLIIVLGTAVWKLHPLPVLLFAAFFFGICNRLPAQKVLETMAAGFGNTQKSIGLIIIAGTVIGMFMERRGALQPIAERILRLTGEKRSPLAMSFIGYLVSMTIFCDSAFVILIGLWRKMSKLSKVSLAVGASALSMGLFASHCFIPPTPGPLAAVSLLSADVGLVILYGSIAAAAAALTGYFFAMRFGKNETPAAEEIREPEAAPEAPVLRRHWTLTLLPLLLPLILIAAASVSKLFQSSLPESFFTAVSFFGNPLTALTLGALAAIFGLGPWRQDELTLNGLLGKGIQQAANILVITGAGGAFGEVLRSADLGQLIPQSFHSAGVWTILLPIFIAAILKTAHGSSTIAIITAAGIMEPLLESLGMTSPSMRALAVCAVCCGGMIVSHTNDSYFWVVTQFSGMNVRQGLKLQTTASFVCGLAAAAVLVIIAFLLR